jgi:alpha-mannosidase
VWINGGSVAERIQAVGSESLTKNEQPYALSFFPDGDGSPAKPLAVLNNHAVEMSAIKQAVNGRDWIIRLFNSTEKKQTAQLKLPVWAVSRKLAFDPFEIKTLKVNRQKQISEVNLIEEKI